MARMSWNEYFMQIAKVTSQRSTCSRKHVGAVIVRDYTILSTGYNGSVRGMAHCDDEGHMMEDSHCVRVVHAEANAIVQAAKNGVRIDGADIYVTASPCWNCFKLIANSGIKRVFYDEFYRDQRTIDMAKQAGIEMIHIGVIHLLAEELVTALRSEDGQVTHIFDFGTIHHATTNNELMEIKNAIEARLDNNVVVDDSIFEYLKLLRDRHMGVES